MSPARALAVYLVAQRVALLPEVHADALECEGWAKREGTDTAPKGWAWMACTRLADACFGALQPETWAAYMRHARAILRDHKTPGRQAMVLGCGPGGEAA